MMPSYVVKTTYKETTEYYVDGDSKKEAFESAFSNFLNEGHKPGDLIDMEVVRSDNEEEEDEDA
jgi:hypothetical protein